MLRTRSNRAYLCCGILAGNSLDREMGDVSGERKLIRKGTYVRAQFEVADTAGDVLIVRVVQMTVEDLLRQCERTF